MGRKNKIKIQRNLRQSREQSPENRKVLGDIGNVSQRSVDMTTVEIVRNMALRETPVEKVNYLLDILDRKNSELLCSRKLIDYLKNQDMDLIEKIQNGQEQMSILESDRSEVLEQLDAFRDKFEDIKGSSSASLDKLKEENEELNEKLRVTTQNLEKSKKELSDLERQFVITNQLVSESQKSSEVVKDEFNKLIAEKSSALTSALAKLEETKKSGLVSVEELEKVRVKLASLEKTNLELIENQQEVRELKEELAQAIIQRDDYKVELDTALRVSDEARYNAQNESSHLEKELEKLREQLRSLESDNIIRKEAVGGLKEQLAEAKKIVEEEKNLLQKDLESAKDSASKSQKEVEVLNQQLQLINSEIENLRKSNVTLSEDLKSEKLVSEQFKQLNQQLQSTNGQLEEQNKSLLAANSSQKNSESLAISKLQDEFKLKTDKFTTEIAELLENNKSLQSELDAAKQSIENEKKTSKGFEQKYVNLQTVFETRFTQVLDDVEIVQYDLHTLKINLANTEQENARLQKTINEIEESKSKLVEESRKKRDTATDELKNQFEGEKKKIQEECTRKVKSSNQRVNKLDKDVKKLLTEKKKLNEENTKLAEELKSKSTLVEELNGLAKSAQSNQQTIDELTKWKEDNQKLVVKLETRISELQRSSENCQKRFESELAASEKKRSEAMSMVEKHEQEVLEVQHLLNSSIEEIHEQEELRKHIASLEAKVQTLEKECSDKLEIASKLKEVQKTLEETAEKNVQLQTRIDTDLSELADIKKSVDKSKKKMEDKLSVVRNKLEKAEKLAKEEKEECKRIKELESKKVEVLEQMAKEEKEATKLTLDASNQVKDQLQRQVELLTVKLDEKSAENVKLVADLQSIQEKLDIVEKVAHEDEVECQRLAALEGSKTEKLSELEKLLAEKTSQLEFLQKEKCHSEEAEKEFVTMVSSKNNEIAAITKSLADEKQKCSELQAHILAIDTLKAEKVQTLQNDLKSLSKKFSLAETEALNLKEDLEIIKRTTAENTSAKNSELEAQLAKLAESKDKEISDFESKIADLTKKLEELPYERERANKLESRIEVIQQSFGHRQRRSEEELSATKQKLEDALKSLIEAKKDNIKIAEFKKRIDNLTSTSIEEKNKILADLEKVKNDLASSEESREADAELVTKLQANLVEDRICFEEEKNHLASALESTQQKLTAADEAKAADAQMIAQLENTVKALELALKTEKQDFLAENVEEVVERVDVPALAATNSGNVVNEEDLDFSSLLSSAHSYHRQLSHRLELLRQNQSIAFYPYIRYLFALYILLLHIWLLW